MSIASYNWNTEVLNGERIRICISDRLNVLPEHLQEETELMYFYRTEGCKYLCKGETLHLSSGELVIINPGELHGCTDWGKDCEAVCVIVNLNEIKIPSLNGISFINKVTQREEIAEIFDSVKNVLTGKNKNSAETDCYINSLILKLFGFLAGSCVSAKKEQKRSEISEITDFIQNNLSEKLTVESLAQKMHLSVDRFYHVFKERTGVSPIKYITQKRILKACEMLKNTDFSIARIAEECNFCTPSYFSKQFYAFMKLTPNSYRSRKGLDDLH